MKTRDEILASWESEGIYASWYAIDSYDPIDSTMHRLFVGTEDEAAKMMRTTYATPTDLAMQPFHRCSLISTADAKAYFDGIAQELDERGIVSATEAAGILGVSRMRVNQLLNEGRLDGFKTGSTWLVYKRSVEDRLHQAGTR